MAVLLAIVIFQMSLYSADTLLWRAGGLMYLFPYLHVPTLGALLL